MACVYAGVQQKPTLCVYVRGMNEPTARQPHARLGYMRNVNICGTQKRRSVLRKVAPNCLPALKKTKREHAVSAPARRTQTPCWMSDDFPLDRRRPPPRVLFLANFKATTSTAKVVGNRTYRGQPFAANIFTNHLQFGG
jgi:hypothetical protein